MADHFAGVDPDAVAASMSSGSDAVAPSTTQVSGEPDREAEAPGIQTTAEQIAELDKLERVRFGGKEYSTKELMSSQMRHADYSKKTSELAETRKYADNFAADLLNLKRDPRLAEEFKRIYPKQYHALADNFLKELSPSPSASQSTTGGEANPNIPPEVQKLLEDRLKPYEEKFQRLDAWEANVKEQETQAISTQIESLHDRLGKKYDLADPDLVDFRVQIAKEKGVDVNTKNLSQVYEQVYKSLHDTQRSRVDKQQTLKVKEQVKAGQTARDVKGGVGIPGAPPKKYSKFSDITKDVMSQFGGK